MIRNIIKSLLIMGAITLTHGIANANININSKAYISDAEGDEAYQVKIIQLKNLAYDNIISKLTASEIKWLAIPSEGINECRLINDAALIKDILFAVKNEVYVHIEIEAIEVAGKSEKGFAFQDIDGQDFVFAKSKETCNAMVKLTHE